MTVQEIRETVNPMVIWMADAVIREARKAITGNTGWNDVKRSPYNLPEVEMAGQILHRMFDTYAAAIKNALLNMHEELNGIYEFRDFNYFDEFVKSLESEISIVKLRQADWVLDRC
ncbi:MAG: hypothetical protein WCX81_01475 [Monoglobales bacterium]